MALSLLYIHKYYIPLYGSSSQTNSHFQVIGVEELISMSSTFSGFINDAVYGNINGKTMSNGLKSFGYFALFSPHKRSGSVVVAI